MPNDIISRNLDRAQDKSVGDFSEVPRSSRSTAPGSWLHLLWHDGPVLQDQTCVVQVAETSLQPMMLASAQAELLSGKEGHAPDALIMSIQLN